MKKRLLSVATITALVLVAGNVFAGGQSDSSGAEEGPVTIEFWYPSANETNDAYFDNVGARFTEWNPNIIVETTALPSADVDITQRLNTAVLSGTYPDVLSAFLVFLGTRGARGEFRDLQPFVDQWDEADDIASAVYGSGQYRGQLVGLGFFPALVVRAYRKDFFEEAGLDPERGPSTWKELREMAIQASVYDDDGNLVRAGMDLPSQDLANVFVEAFMRQAGSLVIDEVAQEPSFTDDGAIQAFEYLADLYAENVSFPHEWADFDTQPFVNNRSAMGNVLVSSIINMINADPGLEDEIGIAPVLEGPVQRKAFVGQRFFVMGESTEHPDEAWEFITFLMSAEEMWERYELLSIPPVRVSLQDQYIEDNPERNSVLSEYIQYGKGKAITPWTNIANTYVAQAYERVIAGEMTAREALMEADRGLRAELEDFSLDN